MKIKTDGRKVRMNPEESVRGRGGLHNQEHMGQGRSAWLMTAGTHPPADLQETQVIELGV